MEVVRENLFPICPICKVAKYCGRECQKADWKKHKPLCAGLRMKRKKDNLLERKGERGNRNERQNDWKTNNSNFFFLVLAHPSSLAQEGSFNGQYHFWYIFGKIKVLFFNRVRVRKK